MPLAQLGLAALFTAGSNDTAENTSGFLHDCALPRLCPPHGSFGAIARDELRALRAPGLAYHWIEALGFELDNGTRQPSAPALAVGFGPGGRTGYLHASMRCPWPQGCERLSGQRLPDLPLSTHPPPAPLPCGPDYHWPKNLPPRPCPPPPPREWSLHHALPATDPKFSDGGRPPDGVSLEWRVGADDGAAPAEGGASVVLRHHYTGPVDVLYNGNLITQPKDNADALSRQHLRRWVRERGVRPQLERAIRTALGGDLHGRHVTTLILRSPEFDSDFDPAVAIHAGERGNLSASAIHGVSKTWRVRESAEELARTRAKVEEDPHYDIRALRDETIAGMPFIGRTLVPLRPTRLGVAFPFGSVADGRRDALALIRAVASEQLAARVAEWADGAEERLVAAHGAVAFGADSGYVAQVQLRCCDAEGNVSVAYHLTPPAPERPSVALAHVEQNEAKDEVEEEDFFFKDEV